jgi:hypothetical protein
MMKDKLFGRHAWLPVVACALVALTSAPAAFAAPPPRLVVIDDFTTGADSLTTTGPSGKMGDSGSMAGGARCVILDVTENPYTRTNTASVGGGHLFIETGVGVAHAATVLYGVNPQCANNPMDLNLKGLDRFRMNFDLLDLPLAGAVVVWSPAGISSIPICVSGVAPGVGFSCDMPFSGFTGPADFEHVEYIAVVLETAGAIFSHDYGINSLTAVLDPEAPAGQHPSQVRTATRQQPPTTPALIRKGR